MSHFHAIVDPKSSDQAQKDFALQKAVFAVFLFHFQTHQRGIWRLPSLTQPSTQDSVILFANTLTVVPAEQSINTSIFQSKPTTTSLCRRLHVKKILQTVKESCLSLLKAASIAYVAGGSSDGLVPNTHSLLSISGQLCTVQLFLRQS